jgi:lysyl-tRNA synthetase class 2
MSELSGYPYRYERTASAGDLQERYTELEPGSGSGQEVRVAGRLLSTREHGKIAFADLKDASGRVQLFAQQAVLGDDAMASFLTLGVGDIVGAEGEVVMTRRGELSLKVTEVTLLAKCKRSMPEKWHGMTDVESRYRQRYLDLIGNPVAQQAVTARAKANAAIRSFLGDRGFLEVETPLLQPIAGGAVARPFITHHNALDIDLYLRIAPELYLKRLLIGGMEKVYELNRSFRNEGVSARHNPEFTMLEGYEAYADYNDTMGLVEALVREVAQAVRGSLTYTWADNEIDLEPAFERLTMFEAIERATGAELLEAWQREDAEAIREAASGMGLKLHPDWTPGKVVMEIYEERVEKTLIQPTFVMGFPKDVSPLAKDHRTFTGFTEHADLVIGGVEIAPIYSELNDPDEQEKRFQQQAGARAAGDDEAQVPDADFLEALAYAMPPAGGWGLGVDRLLVQFLEVDSIREVILFPTLRPEQPS